MLKKFIGLMAVAGLSTAAAFGCTVETTQVDTGDAGTVKKDSGTDPVIDTGDDGGDAGPVGPKPDGTTGKECASSKECSERSLQNGGNACSNEFFTAGGLNPTPVCVGLCAPKAKPSTIADFLCDDQTGTCLPISGNQGICMPICSFESDKIVDACAGKNACNPNVSFTDQSGKAMGLGYCFGGCKADGDCSGGDKCQTETGTCVKELAVATAPKALGAQCKTEKLGQDEDGITKFGCSCNDGTAAAATGGEGYCTQFCRVGDDCGVAGMICSAGLSPETDDKKPLFSAEPTGLAGQCFWECADDAACQAKINGGKGFCEAIPGGKKICIPGDRPTP